MHSLLASAQVGERRRRGGMHPELLEDEVALSYKASAI
jgi:hypothetical protein